MANVSHPLSEILLGVSPESCPNILNFHCHTICSDGSLEPELFIAQASERGLQHIAVTDHHSTQAHYPMNEWLARRSDQGLPVPRLWSGLEISCLLEGCLVHVLALGFEVGHRALHAYRARGFEEALPARRQGKQRAAGNICEGDDGGGEGRRCALRRLVSTHPTRGLHEINHDEWCTPQ